MTCLETIQLRMIIIYYNRGKTASRKTAGVRIFAEGGAKTGVSLVPT
jgi:hypothetical protein